MFPAELPLPDWLFQSMRREHAYATLRVDAAREINNSKHHDRQGGVDSTRSSPGGWPCVAGVKYC